MCGRYYIDDGETIAEMRIIIEEVNMRHHDTPQGPSMKTGEIFPTDTAPVLVMQEQETAPTLMRWGYPKWQGSGVVINARAETAAERPMFRTSIRRMRCIIPSTGFFEWDHTDGHPKTKFLLQRQETPLLYMAGLYSFFEDKSGARYSAFVILTVSANATVSPIHDRMPLIIDAGQNDRWLHDEQYAVTLLGTPCPAELTATRI
jgi:putative SOS response-associated peptidase YedK